MSDVIRILFAPLIWLAAFSLIYGLHGLGCAGDMAKSETTIGENIWPVVLILAWLIAIGIQIVILIGFRQTKSHLAFTGQVSGILAWTALVATVWSLFPVMVMTGCT